MKRVIMAGALLAFAAAGWAQQAQQAQQPAAAAPSSPVAKQPQVKSQAEGQAIQAIFGSADADARIKAVDEFIEKFPDSEFKGVVLMVAAETARQKRDHDKAIIYAERSLEADPQGYAAMIILATEIAGTAREHDLDREEKLGRAEKHAKQAIEMVKVAPRPRADVTDEQWAVAKKQIEAQAHMALGAAQMARKNCQAAIPEFKYSAEAGDPEGQLRLGLAYSECAKYDDAIATFDKIMAATDVPPEFKQFAQAQRARAVQRKGGPAPSAAPATPGAAAPAPAPAPSQAPKP